MFRRRVICFGLLLALAGLIGCADDYAGREPVSGTVTLKGEPLSHASISLVPLENQDTQAGCEVSGGRFDIPRKDGLKPGKYLVRVTAGDGKTPADDEAAGPGGNTNIVSVDLIPADWSEASKQEVVVKAGEKNVFTFAIPDKRVLKQPKKR